MYLRFVEGERPDLDLILEGVADAQPPALRFNPDQDPLFLTHHPNWSVKGLEVVLIGLVFQTVQEAGPGRRRRSPRASGWRAKTTLRAEGLPDAEPDRALPLHARLDLGGLGLAKREYDKAQQASPATTSSSSTSA